MQAEAAAAHGEVPVGAVVAHGSEIIAEAHNLVERRQDATLHAEVLALRLASERLGSWRLKDCVLCVTLEPCPMCIGAAKLARINTLIYAAADAERGAVGSVFDLSQDARLGPNPTVISGIMADKSVELLKKFFAARR